MYIYIYIHIYELNIDKLKNVPTNLSNLKSRC